MTLLHSKSSFPRLQLANPKTLAQCILQDDRARMASNRFYFTQLSSQLWQAMVNFLSIGNYWFFDLDLDVANWWAVRWEEDRLLLFPVRDPCISSFSTCFIDHSIGSMEDSLSKVRKEWLPNYKNLQKNCNLYFKAPMAPCITQNHKSIKRNRLIRNCIC
jgi:hypothetical protein